MSKVGRGSGRPPGPRKPRIPFQSLPVPAHKRKDSKISVEIPLGPDGSIESTIAEAVKARVARWLTDEQLYETLRMMAFQAVRPVTIHDAETGETRTEFEPIGEATQASALKQLDAMGERMMQMVVDKAAGRRGGVDGPEDADAIRSLKQRYGDDKEQ